MKPLRIFLSTLIAALLLAACTFTVSVPTIDTGSTQTLEIAQPVPSGVSEADVAIEMGGGRLNISGGSSDLVEGTVVYNVADWKPALTQTGSGVLISQNHTTNVGIPTGDIKNDWTLKLGSVPMSLRISAGAYEGTLNLSGISLTNLDISDGASNATVRFDSLNPVQMQRLSYKTGASNVTLLGLGNANVSQIVFTSGAGNYTLDFSGALTHDINAKISSGFSQVKVIVPQNVHTLINLTGGVSNVDAEGTWTKSGTQYEAGSSGPTLTIDIEMAVGNLVLQQH